MGRKYSPVELLQAEGPPAFLFLVEKYGFTGPEHIVDGLQYERSGLKIEIRVWAHHHEAGFTTMVSWHEQRVWGDLGCLYVACGLGPLQAVPDQMGGAHTVRKRITQHSDALRKVMPHLDGPGCVDLLRRCKQRLLPE